MPVEATEVVDPGFSVNAITPIILTIDPTRGEDGAPGPPGQGMNWRGEWQTGVFYKAYDAVSRNTSGASYIAIVDNTSVDPATDNGSVWGVLSGPGAVGPPGPPGIQYRGAWVSTASYILNDLVARLGSTYIAVSPSTGIDPSTDTGHTHWQIFAAAGAGGDMYKSQYAIGNGQTNTSLVDHAMYADAATTAANATTAQNANNVPWTGVTGKPVTMPPSAHEATHLPAGADPLPLAGSTTAGLMRQTSGLTTDFIDGTNTCQSLVAAVQPTIWAARLRTYNGLDNPTFEVDQRTCGAGTPLSGAFSIDRWIGQKQGATMAGTGKQQAGIVPGTGFALTQNFFRITLTAQQASLATTDLLVFSQTVEGATLRELVGDATSLSFLVRCSVAGLTFGISIRDPSQAHSYVIPATIPTANVWTTFSFANIPVFPPGSTFSTSPGVTGALFMISLAAGANYITPANNSWQNGNLVGAQGQGNFAALPVGSTFDIGVIQWEPGNQCSQFIDLSYQRNLDRCRKFFQKSYDDITPVGTATTTGAVTLYVPPNVSFFTPVFFAPKMIKDPTVVGYSPATGAANTVRDYGAGIDRAISGNGLWAGQYGFTGFILATTNAAQSQQAFQWTADTGW